MARAPLNTTFMVASIVGFLISVAYVSTFSLPWAVAFGVVFLAMFIASFVSMTRATPDEQLLPRPRTPTVHGRIKVKTVKRKKVKKIKVKKRRR